MTKVPCLESSRIYKGRVNGHYLQQSFFRAANSLSSPYSLLSFLLPILSVEQKYCDQSCIVFMMQPIS
jgi:hypothetical protein